MHTPYPQFPEDSAAQAPAPVPPPSRSGREVLKGARKTLGWLVVAALSAIALLTVFPDALAFISKDLRLSATSPFAQVVALRSGLALIVGTVSLIVFASAAVRFLRKEGGLRTLALAVVLALVAATHLYVLAGRGLGGGQQVSSGPIVVDPSQWDGTVTVLSLNTKYESVNVVELAQTARDLSPEVLVLPEATSAYGEQVAGLLAQDGYTFTVYSSQAGLPSPQDPQAPAAQPAEDETPAAEAQDQEPSAQPAAAPSASTRAKRPAALVSSTTVLVSSVLGEYEQAPPPESLSVGAVVLNPVGDSPTGRLRPTLMAVHTVAPVGGRVADWRQSVSDAVASCAPTQITKGLIVAGDFNATMDNAPMRELGDCDNAGVQAHIGGLATWPTTSPTRLLGATIDHVLVDRSAWQARAGQVLRVKGSDHRAVLVDLAPVG